MKTKMRDQMLIKTRERTMRYTMSDFIKAVHARPQLWERYHADYGNRDKRELAWHEVATCLCSKFDTMTSADKHKTVVMLTKRWKNTRDSFFRAQRRSRSLSGKNDEHPRAYIYTKEMSFLLQMQNDEHGEFENEVGTDDNIEVNTTTATSKEKHNDDSIKTEVNDDNDNDGDDDACNEPSKKKRRLVAKPTLGVKKPQSTISYDLSDSNDVIDKPKTTPRDNKREFSEVDSSPKTTETSALKETSKERAPPTSNKNSSRLAETPKTETDPDQSFFDSIKPVIHNMNMDQKLDFQIEVLKLLKYFRGKQ